MREPVAAGAARCQAAVLIGPDRAGVAAALPPVPVLRARRVHGPEVAMLAGRRCSPSPASPGRRSSSGPLAKRALSSPGACLFRDHHRYTDRELHGLLETAARFDAVPVTTAKDAVRMQPALRTKVSVAGVGIAWEDPPAIEALLSYLFPV